jgi:hypothetical protein
MMNDDVGQIGEPSPAQQAIIVLTSPFELLLHPLAIMAAMFNLLIVFNTSLLHPNLKCILLAQSVSIFVVFIQIKL